MEGGWKQADFGYAVDVATKIAWVEALEAQSANRCKSDR